MFKYVLLLWLLLTKPRWAYEKIRGSSIIQFINRKHYKNISNIYGSYIVKHTEFLKEFSNIELENIINIYDEAKDICINSKSVNSIIPKEFDASDELSKLCYCIVRIKKPLKVVETGVGRGVTSFYILEAMRKNGRGRLYSIDLPWLRFGAKKSIGCLIPEHLRARWTLIFGPGELEMKKLYKEIESIDMFLHDSDHKYNIQKSEYNVAFSWLNMGGIMVSDDVNNNALYEIYNEYGGKLFMIKQSKKTDIGILLKNS